MKKSTLVIGAALATAAALSNESSAIGPTEPPWCPTVFEGVVSERNRDGDAYMNDHDPFPDDQNQPKQMIYKLTDEIRSLVGAKIVQDGLEVRTSSEGIGISVLVSHEDTFNTSLRLEAFCAPIEPVLSHCKAINIVRYDPRPYGGCDFDFDYNGKSVLSTDITPVVYLNDYGQLVLPQTGWAPVVYFEPNIVKNLGSFAEAQSFIQE